MATGLAPAVANAIYDALYNNTPIGAGVVQVATPYIQLHTADPGAAGTLAVAGNTTRKPLAAVMAVAAGGAVTSDTAITWTTGEVTTTEIYSHFSIWDASTAGNFKQSGTITGGSVTAGNQFSLPIGNLDFTLSVAA